MKHIFSVCLFIFPFFVFAQTAESFYEEATAAAEAGDYRKALKAVENAIEQDNTKVEYFNLKGECFIELKKYQEAYDVLSKAIIRFPKDAMLYYNRADVFYMAREFEQSIRDFEKAFEYAQDDSMRVSCLINSSGTRFDIRDFQGGYEDLEKAYSIDSMNLGVLNNLGLVSDELGKTDEAIKYFTMAAKVAPESVLVYANLGFLYQNMGKYEEAMPYFDKAVEIDPELGVPYNNRGYNRLMMGDTKGALKDINQSLKLYPNNSYAYRNRALVYIEMNKMKKACEDLAKAIEFEFTRSYGNEVIELQEKHCKG